jgi:hypothetical protein
VHALRRPLSTRREQGSRCSLLDEPDLEGQIASHAAQQLHVKGGILIWIWDEQELAAIRPRIASQSAPWTSCNDGERAFKKVSRCSLQQTTAAFVFHQATKSGEEQ